MNMFYSLKHIRRLRSGLIPRSVLVSMKRNIRNIKAGEITLPALLYNGTVKHQQD